MFNPNFNLFLKLVIHNNIMKIKHISHLIPDSSNKSSGLVLDSQLMESYELTNKNGLKLTIINFGAAISALKIPTKNGTIVDVVLGFDVMENYIKSFALAGAPYFGATVGRYAGRIANAAFKWNGEIIQLNKNHGLHSLHGGKENLSQKLWKLKSHNHKENPSITLNYLSTHNSENFPGDLEVDLTYTLSEDNEITIEYKARTTQDTIVNLTHHSYFNLDGHNADLSNQKLIVNSGMMLETTEDLIPTGRFLNLKNHPFDFSQAKICPTAIDTTFVLEKDNEFAASLISTKNGLGMSVFTNQPAVHIYVGGQCSSALKGKENTDYHSNSGICFETQNFPDAPNHDHFPSSVLRKGNLYHHKTIYKFELF